MKKRLVVGLLVLVLLLSMIPFGPVAAASVPEAPQNLMAREENGMILLRWTLPESAIAHIENELDGELFYAIDWRVNNGSWHFDVPAVRMNTYDMDNDLHTAFIGYVGNQFWDEEGAQEGVVVHWSVGLDSDIDLLNNQYDFRMRLALYNPELDDNQDYLTSPYSNTISIGGQSGPEALTSLEAPKGLKVQVVEDDNGLPLFQLGWSNPESVVTANKDYPVHVKVDFKVGNGKWFSETHTHDWWSSDPMTTAMQFNPVEREYVDRIVIEENVYAFRLLYAYEPYEKEDSVYSPYSNTVMAGIQAHDWAIAEVKEAMEAGLIPDILKGVDLTKPINREEFAELSVLLYEKASGNMAEPVSPNPFTDTTNPQILKAYTIGITKGTTPSTFSSKMLINREQCATMLFRALKAIRPDEDYSVEGVNDFPDQQHISSFAVDATKYMSRMGIIKGAPNGTFMPRATTSVEEASGYGMATREAAILMTVRTYKTVQ